LPETGSPTVRRRELGKLLRALRTDNGLTVEQVADRLDFSPSKVSRLETGQRGASARDIKDLCDFYGVSNELREQLSDLAAKGKQQAWWQSRNLRYSSYVGLEDEANLIRDFGLGVVTGLLQTPDYARAVLRARVPRMSAEMIEEHLASRAQRQRLLTSDTPPHYEALIDEAVLYRVPADKRIMRGQLQHLLDASELPHLEVRVLPFNVGLLPESTNKFIILGFEQPTLGGVVFIEHLTGDVYLDRDEEVSAHEEAFNVMREMAATPDETRAIFRRISSDLSG
jgi:transcriptional regulator with XRE-family HTH domain